MRILVTGGGGYVGSIVVPRLLAEGYQVTVIDNFLYGQASLLDCCASKNFTVIRGDARDRHLIKHHLEGVDFIFPLACLVGAPLCQRDPIGAKTLNYDAVKLILDLRNPDQKIIFPTTNSGYGIGQDGIHCTEETPLNPISLYGRLKCDIEADLLTAGNCITLRLATVFGISPRMRLDLLVNDFVYRAFRDKTLVLFEPHFKRNYLHVRDVAKAFIHCVREFDTLKNHAYNVGRSDANLSKQELCEVIKSIIPDFVYLCSDIGSDPDKRNYIVSNAKIESTGYFPDVSLEDGIRELLKGYQVIRPNSYANL